MRRAVMFKFRGDSRALISYEPAEGKCQRFIVTSSKVCSADIIDDFIDESLELDQKYINDFNKKTDQFWDWLNLANPSIRNEVLAKMLKYQYEFPNIIYLCEQKIIDLLYRFRVREKYPNWQAIDSDELEKRLKEVYGYNYIADGGYVM